MPTQYVPARIGNSLNSRVSIVTFPLSLQTINRSPSVVYYTCQTSGDSVILVADQVLYFGDELHCSLINPHQIRSHRYGVCDDPWDPHRSIGIDLNSIFIPLKPDGPNLCFESRVPTDWEMEYLPIIKITSSSWNPADLVDCISSARRDIWDQSTAPLSGFPPFLTCDVLSPFILRQPSWPMRSRGQTVI